MISLREIWAIPTLVLLLCSIVMVAPSFHVFADSSDITECSASFSGTISEPFNAETMITINATKGNYDVEFDYAHAVGEEGTVSFVKSSALEPSSVIFVEGETISTILTSGETIVDDGVITLYHKDLSDCEIIFDNSSIPGTSRIVLPVTITDLDSSRFLVNATIPDKESAIDFTKMVIRYVTNPEASVSYNVRNVSVVASDDGVPTGTIAEATTQATGQSMFTGGRTFYGEQFGPEAEIINQTVDCATVELRRHDSPIGNATIGFYDSNMSLVKQFGTIDVSTLTTGYKAYEFCLPSSDNGHTILANQILAVAYSDGDAINRIDVRRSNIGSGPDYDGLAAYHVNYDTIWHIYNTEDKNRDLLFKLTNS